MRWKNLLLAWAFWHLYHTWIAYSLTICYNLAHCPRLAFLLSVMVVWVYMCLCAFCRRRDRCSFDYQFYFLKSDKTLDFLHSKSHVVICVLVFLRKVLISSKFQVCWHTILWNTFIVLKHFYISSWNALCITNTFLFFFLDHSCQTFVCFTHILSAPTLSCVGPLCCFFVSILLILASSFITFFLFSEFCSVIFSLGFLDHYFFTVLFYCMETVNLCLNRFGYTQLNLIRGVHNHSPFWIFSNFHDDVQCDQYVIQEFDVLLSLTLRRASQWQSGFRPTVCVPNHQTTFPFCCPEFALPLSLQNIGPSIPSLEMRFPHIFYCNLSSTSICAQRERGSC